MFTSVPTWSKFPVPSQVLEADSDPETWNVFSRRTTRSIEPLANHQGHPTWTSCAKCVGNLCQLRQVMFCYVTKVGRILPDDQEGPFLPKAPRASKDFDPRPGPSIPESLGKRQESVSAGQGGQRSSSHLWAVQDEMVSFSAQRPSDAPRSSTLRRYRRRAGNKCATAAEMAGHPTSEGQKMRPYRASGAAHKAAAEMAGSAGIIPAPKAFLAP